MPTTQEWKELFDEEPDNELLRFSLAKSYFDDKNFADSLEHFEYLVTHQEDFALAWSFLARCHLELGDEGKAREAAEKGLELALKQKHEVPEMEARAVLDELDSEF
jgi:predicted Zn-dependent protease